MSINKRKELVAIVTGSGGSIGSSIVNSLINEGYFVFGLDIVNHIESEHFEFLNFDLISYRKLADFVDKNITLGQYNVLVNCAGIREIETIDNLSLNLWEEVMSINLHAPFILSKTIASTIINNDLEGSIVNIASVSGLLGEPNRTAYVTSKHALIGLTKQLAIEFGKYGIRANSISPGITETNMTRDYFKNPQQMALISAGNYLNNIGQPEDISNAVLFVTNKQAKYITGSNIIVDGGWTAGKNI